MRTPPDALGGYQISRRIATSDVVTTYLAFAAPQLAARGRGMPAGRKVALHVADVTTGTAAAASADIFRQHAAAVADIDHPAIAPIVDVGHDGERSYVATAWMDAITLGQLLDRRWRLSVDDTVRLFSDVAAALDVLHARGIVHQALSPHTIWVERDGDGPGRAFLTGFGNAALLADRLRPGDSGDTGLLDAALYVAPEQLRGTTVDGRADQYALACALYHCIAGKPPFVRDTLPALFGAHLFARPTPPTGVLSPPLQEALVAGLAKQPRDRHPSCRSLLRAVGPPVDPVPAADHTAVPGATVEMPRPAAAARDLAGARSAPREHVVVPVDDTVQVSEGAGVSRWLASAPRQFWLLGALVVLGGVLGVLGVLLVTRAPSDPETSGDVLANQSGASADTVDLSAAAETDATQPAVAPPDIAWRSRVQGGGVRTVTFVDGTAIAATKAGLYGLDAMTGEPRWEHPVAARDADGVTAVGDVVVYRSVGVLEGLDVGDGEELWVRSAASAPDGRLSAGPDTLYGIGSGGGAPEIVAVDPATGDERWHHHFDTGNVVQTDIAVDAGLAVLGQDGRLTALDLQQTPVLSSAGRPELAEPLWTADVTDLREATLLLTDGAVVFVTTDGQLCSHDAADGRRRWCTPVGDATSGSPVVDGASALVVVTSSGVAAVDADSGAERWRVDAAGRLTGAVVVFGDLVAVAEDEGSVRALSLDDGAEHWEVDVGKEVLSLAADDGGLLAGTRSGGVVRLEPTVD